MSIADYTYAMNSRHEDRDISPSPFPVIYTHVHRPNYISLFHILLVFEQRQEI